MLGRSQELVAKAKPGDGGAIWAALLQSFGQVEKQCAETWDKVANQVLVGPQARVLVHLGVHNWGNQVLLTQLFAQVIPGIRLLTGLVPAVQPGNTWVLQQAAPVGTVQ